MFVLMCVGCCVRTLRWTPMRLGWGQLLIISWGSWRPAWLSSRSMNPSTWASPTNSNPSSSPTYAYALLCSLSPCLIYSNLISISLCLLCMCTYRVESLWTICVDSLDCFCLLFMLSLYISLLSLADCFIQCCASIAEHLQFELV